MLAIMPALAVLFLLSGLDELAVDLAWLYAWLEHQWNEFRLRRAGLTFARRLDRPESSMAILVPLWQEHEVIGAMLEHNVAAVRYGNYHFFVGVYPNDHETVTAVTQAASRFPNVHMALCPHDGPTSKADCLNWIYQNIGLYEDRNDMFFEVLVTHDAEDMIHPDELAWINYYTARYDFVQIPVFALPTPFRKFTHGVYCDEFAECHSRDMVVRSRFRRFVPGSGVGTGYRREALEKLAQSASNRIFEPEALTEDYENGLRLHRLGCSQVFALPWRTAGPGSDFVATREYFPQNWTAARRQRTRWVMGIALQGWERLGWSGKLGEVYWFWRDRKGLICSPLGVLANATFLYGLVTAMWMRMSPLSAALCNATFALQVIRMSVRMAAVTRIYGWPFALGVPLRAVYGNLLNATATLHAVVRYTAAKLRGEPLRWLKTEHSYPTRATLLSHKRRLGEILIGSGCLEADVLAQALKTQPAGMLLGQHLISLGLLKESELYECLSLQQGLPFTRLAPTDLDKGIARSLPRKVSLLGQLLPFRIEKGSLHIATPNVPAASLNSLLAEFTSLEIHFHLVTPGQYEQFAGVLI